MPEPIPVFDTARSDEVDLEVALPASWAALHERVQVMFEDTDVLGWHATLESAQGEALLAFPWEDHVDKKLRGEVPSDLPDAVLKERNSWEDLDQGWWGVVRVVGDVVFIAEANFDNLVDIAGAPTPRLMRPGRVDVSGVEVTWSRIPRTAWERAWEAARESCLRGAPAPSRRPRGAGQ